MDQKMKNRIRTLLFVLGGALLGLGYYAVIGCSSGGCVITSSPFSAMAYMGLMGWILSGVFEKDGGCGCNI